MEYLWVLLALISAFSLATSDALTKKALRESNEYLAAWFRLLFSLPLLLAVIAFIPIPELDRTFYIAFFIALPIEIITIILYIKALKISPLNLSLPFLALTPLFLIFISYCILGEKVTFWGGTGIFLITSGSYILNINEAKGGILRPFIAIANEKGSIYMILVALLYSITASMGKMAIEHSSPLFFAVTYFTALTVFFAPIAFWKARSDVKKFLDEKHYNYLLVPGFFYGLMAATHMLAMNLTKVAYMLSVKRLSLLIGITYGYLLFKEENFRERLFGATLMFIGFVMVVTAG